jgi:hypothetical protein
MSKFKSQSESDLKIIKSYLNGEGIETRENAIAASYRQVSTGVEYSSFFAELICHLQNPHDPAYFERESLQELFEVK